MNLLVNVFDDGLAVGVTSIRDTVLEFKDKRLRYVANPVRFGHARNDAQILNRIDPDSWALLLSSDLCLSHTMLETLLQQAQETRVPMARSWAQSHAYELLLTESRYEFTQPFRDHPRIENLGLVDALPLISDYYSQKNLTGEWYGFSLYGTLFHGALSRNFENNFLKFAYHGFDQYLSMMLLLAAQRVCFVGQPLIHDIVGAPRFGPPRPQDGTSRADCLLAAEEFLSEHELELASFGLDTKYLRSGQVHKADYYLDHYDAMAPRIRMLRDYNYGLLEGRILPLG